MKIPLVNLETLRKFNNGKNAKALKAECDDSTIDVGSHRVTVTVTLDGYVDQAADGERTRTTFPKGGDAFAIALSKVNEATRNVIVQAVMDVQRGAVVPGLTDKAGKFTPSDEIKAALDSLTVTKTTPTSGDTVFRGCLVVEDTPALHRPVDEVAENIQGLTVAVWG